jgi:adenine-specific DNA-methyltransferase
MKKLTANDPETKSADVVAENLAHLQAIFPKAFTEGRIDFAVLRQLLGGAVDDTPEKYGLNWHGKRAFRQLALTPSTGTLLPSEAESVDWDTTQNLMIEGDNLEVLKLLQKSYANSVKLIYIDPPYNTGKDFVYPDDFQDNIANYKNLTSQNLTSNPETNGRFHTDWLNMMYPRLAQARNLLREDGFLIVSIDDSEQGNLRSLLNETFGEENFVAVLVFDRNRKNDAKLFSVGHEYMIVYARNKALLTEHNVQLRSKKIGVEDVRKEFERLRAEHGDNWAEVGRGLRDYYKTFKKDDPRRPLSRFTKVDERGPYRTDGNPSWPGGGGPFFDVPHPVTRRPCKPPSRGWVWSSYERMKEEIDKGNIVFGADETTVPGVRMTLFESDDQVMRSVLFSYAQKASQDFAELFDGKRVFDNPKSIVDLERLVDYIAKPGDLVLDFFAGSGTTGHAVMAQNAIDNGKRRFILVQLPEPLDSTKKEQKLTAELCDQLGKPRNLAELTKERLRRAAKKVKAEHPDYTGDLGFRVFKLDSSNIKAWDPNREVTNENLLSNTEHLVEGRTDEDVLYELLLKLGLDLTVPIEEKTIGGHTVYSIGLGKLMVCLANDVTHKAVEPLAMGIIKWHKELKPEGDVSLVFKDSGFADDVSKSNLTAILEQHGLKNVRSV